MHGLHRYWRSAFTERISDDLIDELVEGAGAFSSPLSALIFFYMHGAATRVPADATPSPRGGAMGFRRHRAVGGRCRVGGHIAWVRAVWDAHEPHLEGSAYVNHLAEDDRPEKVRASYGENYARLRQAKAAYDPDNLFRVNANIQPSS